MPISTHILDTSLGKPAPGVPVALEHNGALLARGTTDGDGRIRDFAPKHALHPGTYRLVFSVGEYFASRKVTAFYPEIIVQFTISSDSEAHHVPLLLSPFGYSTYRGS